MNLVTGSLTRLKYVGCFGRNSLQKKSDAKNRQSLAEVKYLPEVNEKYMTNKNKRLFAFKNEFSEIKLFGLCDLSLSVDLAGETSDIRFL